MMMDFPWLSSLLASQILGALFVAVSAAKTDKNILNIRRISIISTATTFLISIAILLNYPTAAISYQFVEKYTWIPQFNINFHLGVDSISISLVILTSFLFLLTSVSSLGSPKKDVKAFYLNFLILEALIHGAFVSLDIVLFFFFFEGVLIPMFFIIGIWGGQRRIYSAYKLFIYTFAGSVLMLLAIVFLYRELGFFDIETISSSSIPLSLQIPMFLAFLFSFAVKTPMWPFHTWLPDAHVEAPTAGSVILAGILLKMGGYGILRIAIPFFPDAARYFAPLIYVLSGIGLIYASLVALAQKDIKKLVAYSSVAHMAYVTAGLFSFNQEGIEGAFLQMISHGIISGALFMIIGMLYERFHSRELDDYGGLAQVMPKLFVFMVVFMMGSVALPGTSGFAAEFLVLLGCYKVNVWLAVVMAGGVILGATYMLLMVGRVFFGEKSAHILVQKDIYDLKTYEQIILFVLSAGTVFLGLFPNMILNFIEPSVQFIIKSLP